MLQHRVVTSPSFKSCSELLLPVMHHYLSGDQNKKIVLSISLSIHSLLIVPIEKINSDCITLENFVAIADERMNKEIRYKEEIMQLKDNIYEEFNELCKSNRDEVYINFIRDQAGLVINTLLEEAKIDDKMVSEKFFNEMMNGFESEALNLNNFEKTSHVILWKPLLTPFPIWLLNMIKNSITELSDEKSIQKVEITVQLLIRHIKNHMIGKEINDTDFSTTEKLKLRLENFVQERQICNVKLFRTHENENVIREFKEKCVETVTIEAKSTNLLNKEITIQYDELFLEAKIKAYELLAVFDKIQKNILSLGLKLGNGNIMNLKKNMEIWPKFKLLNNLNLDFEDCIIEETGASAISTILETKNNILILTLGLWNNNIRDEGAKVLSKGLKQLKSVCSLTLNLGLNCIGKIGAQEISVALQKLINISTLNLDFSGNNDGENTAKAISNALKQLDKISSLTLKFWAHDIGDKGVKAISESLTKLRKITTLNLNFWQNNIEEEGAMSISDALKNLACLSSLTLNFKNNSIGWKGGEALSKAITQLTSISTIIFDLSDTNIGVKGSMAIYANVKELINITTMNLDLPNDSIGAEEKVAFEQLMLAHPEYKIVFKK